MQADADALSPRHNPDFPTPYPTKDQIQDMRRAGVLSLLALLVHKYKYSHHARPAGDAKEEAQLRELLLALLVQKYLLY